MKRFALLASAALTSLIALPLAAGAPTDPLAYVPPDATAVGMVRVSDLRTSPYAARIFDETDHVTCDGDGARFLAEAHLKPTEDVDTVVFAGTPGTGGKKGNGVAIFEGRFDAASLEAALLARGATKEGVLLILPESADHPRSGGEPGAIAFVGKHLAVAGPRASVQAALASAGARADFRTGAGLGKHLRRVPSDATAWALVDLARAPWKERNVHVEGEVHGEGGSEQVVKIAGVMKQVGFLSLSATLKSDGMKVAAFGSCDDAETRGLLEDSLRGLLAAWRLGVQEKKPELVPVLRGFKVEQTKDGVSLAGTIPGPMLEAFLSKKK